MPVSWDGLDIYKGVRRSTSRNLPRRTGRTCSGKHGRTFLGTSHSSSTCLVACTFRTGCLAALFLPPSTLAEVLLIRQRARVVDENRRTYHEVLGRPCRARSAARLVAQE